jgi:OmcA/MtrC family decaheme c-type cytochrome
MRKSMFYLVALSLLFPLLFFGCGSGSDGSAGASGAAGAPGAPGAPGDPGPGVLAGETCTLCHGKGQTYDVAAMHRIDPTTGNKLSAGTASVTIDNVVFGTPAGDNVPVTVNFTFSAINSAGTNITSSIDLRELATGSTTNLAYPRFSLAKLVAGTAYPASGTQEPNNWNVYVVTPGATGSGPYSSRIAAGMTGTPATGVYSFTFPDNSVRVSDGYVDNVVHRVGVQVSGLTVGLFTSDPILQTSSERPVANATLDRVSVAGGAGTTPTGAYPTRDIVTTAACNACHDPLAIHGGGRRETKLCATCHNAKLEIAGNPAGGGWDNSNLLNLVHKVHRSQNIGELGDFTEVTFPQDIRNCKTCHKGTDGDNWKNRPSKVACGSCHTTVNFTTGTGHLGGAQANNQFCALCHPASAITIYHATENSTPNNPADPPGLTTFEYGIDTVTVDSTNRAVVKFWIKSAVAGADGSLGAFSFLNLGASGTNATLPTGFTGGPSFLVAYANNVTTPADYSNFGKSAAQPVSVSLIGLSLTGTPTQYTVTLPSSSAFPAGAKMRAVALQGYFTQTNVDISIPVDGILDNVGRHTPAVVKNVTGDAVRRVVVKSGYDNVAGVLTPVGCLECHEVFEGHGGNRVNNVQVCVLCHNPNLTSSGRTIDPAGTSPINPAIVALYGSNPLAYPEVPNNFKDLIHGIHSREVRDPAYPFVDIRNRTASGVAGVLVDGAEITYPGNPRHCTKCHIGETYKADLATGALFSTAKITTGVSTETRTQINTARGTVANSTDLVNSPIVGACGMCHNSDSDRSHFGLNGGDIQSIRATAELTPPTLSVTPSAP